MMYEGRGPAFDGDYAHAHAPEPQPYERTAEQKAADASTVAANFDHQVELVRTGVAAMNTAADARDLDAWTTAKRNADQALRQLAHLAKSAPTTAHAAVEPDVRKRLASAEQVLEDAQQLVAHAPPAPSAAAPELGCGDALLAALPPDPPPAAWRDPDFQAATDAVAAICAHRMTSSNIAAFRRIVSGHEDHVIARRFRRFGEERRDADDTAVLEIPTGLDENELAAAVAAQLRALQLQLGPQHGTSAGGAPLPPDVRADMEQALGADFSAVRVHEDGQAEAVRALAFTRGADIHFAPGRYDPHGSSGRQLLGHELTHVAQQAQGRVSPTKRLNGQATNDDPALEQEADSKGALAASTTGGGTLPSPPTRPASPGSVQANSASSAPVQAKFAPAPEASVDGQPTFDVSSALTTAPIQRQRDENSTAHQPLNAERYWSKYGARTLQTALHRAMAEVVFEIAAPGLSFPTSECGPFILKSFGWRMQDTAPHHVSQLLDTPLYELIDGVRALDDRGRGPDVFEPAIVSRIVERLGRGVHRAVARLALPYAKARSRLVSAKVTGSPIEQGLGPIQTPTAPKSDPATGQPDPNTLGARTAIEHAVAARGCTAMRDRGDPGGAR